MGDSSLWDLLSQDVADYFLGSCYLVLFLVTSVQLVRIIRNDRLRQQLLQSKVSE